ncbi:hypothetical protein HN51_045163 [Arachis hypogaea]|uniref:GDSL esterase/lipase n=2 Tax=Arachis TaxID=3817 RepID=A0A444XZV5_ARAHY|nr:GDSL esterase/lipase At1g54790-like [Arachis hypogaea]QHN97395.1 GDSL esterase/lipase [Arachis hypogaea]RYQ95207.1 hypothetical protein Ahy_B08g090269 [Arachis hypogaea]
MMISKNNVVAFQVLLFLIFCLGVVNSAKFRYPSVFNFGDSNSDTGGQATLMGMQFPPAPKGNFKVSGRWSNGGLILDFLMKKMRLPTLNPYLYSLGLPNFSKGCNFAAAGSTILKPTDINVTPLNLETQVSQFLLFKARALQLVSKDKKLKKYLPNEDAFKKGLYMIDIGQNDLSLAFKSNKTLDQVLASIPNIIGLFETAITKLYENGARSFWIHNTGPLGCLAVNVAKFESDPSKLDEHGCVISYNEAATTFNLQLRNLCDKFQHQYPNATVTHVDIFAIKLNLITNYSKLGFKEPIKSCCGNGGKLNVEVSCGLAKMLNNGSIMMGLPCSNMDDYVSWDGIHYTDAANKYVASQILSGKYFVLLSNPKVFLF